MDLQTKPPQQPRRRIALESLAARNENQQWEEFIGNMLVKLELSPAKHAAAIERYKELARHVDAHDFERNAAALAEIGAEIRPCVRIRTEAMVHMHRAQADRDFERRCESAKRVQQDNRIAPAGDTNAKTIALFQARQQEGFEFRREGMGRWGDGR